MHKPKVKIISFEFFQRRLEGFSNIKVVGIVKLGGEEDFVARDTGGFNTETNFGLISIGSSCINVPIAILEGMLNGMLNGSWL